MTVACAGRKHFSTPYANLLRVFNLFLLAFFLSDSVGFAQTVIYTNSGASYNNSNGVTNNAYGPIPVDGCSSISMSIHYNFSVPFPGSGNMESSDECIAGCAGDPNDPTAGGCDFCWDFFYVQFQVDGVTVNSQLIGVPGFTAQSGTLTYGPVCTGSASTVGFIVQTQTWAANETITFDNLTVTCWDGGSTLTANPTSACQGSPFTLSATLDNPTSVGSTNWSGPGTITSPGALTTTVTNAPLGTNTYTFTATDDNACNETTSIDVDVNPAPTVDQQPNIVACAGDQVDIMFTGSDPSAVYNWTASLPILGGVNGTGDISGQIPDPLPFPVTVTITVTATNGSCTSPPMVFSVSAINPPSATMTLNSPAMICQGQNANFSVNIAGGVAPYTIIYSIDGTPQPPVMTNSTSYNFTLPGLTNDVTVALESIQSGTTGCLGNTSGNYQVMVTPTPTATITPGSINVCSSDPVQIEVELTGNPDWVVLYSINNIGQPPQTTSSSPYVIELTPTNPNNVVTVTGVSSNGCPGTATGSYTVTLSNSLSATLTAVGPTTVCAGQTANLSVNFTGGTAPYTFSYSINGVIQPDITTSTDPYIFTSPALTADPSVIILESLSDDTGCTGSTSGTVSIGLNDAPIAVLTTDTITACAGAQQTAEVALSGDGPYTLIYSINNVAQPAVTIPAGQAFYDILFTPGAGLTLVTLNSVSNGGTCPGSVSGIYGVQIGPPPTVVLSGTDTICTGASAPLMLDFTGTGPFTVNYTANGIAQTNIITSMDPFIFNVTPTNNVTNYVLTGVSQNGCSGTFSGNATITVQSPISATISGGGQICQGGSGTNLTVDFTGQGPWTFIYNAGPNNPQPPITTSTTPYVFNVNPPNGTTYTLDSVYNATCPGSISGSALVFVFTPPSVSIGGGGTYCDSVTTNISFDFTGTGPFTFNYTKDGVAQTPITTFDDPFLLPVMTTVSTTYIITNIESPGCTGVITVDSATIVINKAPNYANVNLNCNPALFNYVVTFDVLGATPPLTLVSGSGSFTGTQFTSTPIAQGTGYSFVFHDANNCSDVTVSGPSTCNCQTNAGTMQLDTLHACETETITAIHNNNFVNDGNDQLMFILHDTPALPLGTIFAWNTIPVFGIQPGMNTNQVYYISAIAGNPLSGQIDPADICRSVSQGTPVVFHETPVGDMGTLNTTLCAGDTIELTVNFTGTPSFSFANLVNGVQQTAVGGITSSVYTYQIAPTVNTVIQLDSISDKYCDDGMVSGMANIQVFNAPVASAATTACNFATATYTVSFTMTSGAQPYTVSGMTGTFTGNAFTSDPIPFGTPYFATIADVNNCGLDTIQGISNCNCTSSAGVMSTTPVMACTGSTLSVPPTTGQVLDGDDILAYILHDASGNMSGNIIAWSSTPSFTFSAPMQTGVQYYISAVVGNPGAPGQVDPLDPCRVVAVGTPVMWNASPTANISGTFDVCPGVSQQIGVTLTGTPNYTLVYQYNNQQYTIPGITGNAFNITANLLQSSTFTLVSIQDANCPGTVSGSASVEVHPTPAVVQLEAKCSPDGLTYVVEFYVSQGDTATIQVTGLTGSLNTTNGYFISDPIPVQNNYAFTLNDIWQCGSLSLSGTPDCQCVTDVGTFGNAPVALCAGENVSVPGATGFTLQPGDALVYFLTTTTDPLTWSILATSNTPDFAYQSGLTQPGVTYYIMAVAANQQGSSVNLSDPCRDIVTGPTVLWRPLPTATLSGSQTVCAGTPIALSVLLSGNGPFQLAYTANGTAQMVTANMTNFAFAPSIINMPTTTYVLTDVTDQFGCKGMADGTAVVNINPTPQVLNQLVSCNFTDETYVLTFDISNGTAANPVYTVTGLPGSLTDTTWTSTPQPGSSSYSVVISDPTGCSTTISGVTACVCLTDAGAVGPNLIDVCTNELVVANVVIPPGLDNNDVIQYILYEDPAQLPNGIIASAPIPQFTFQTGMTAGTTYHIAAVAGNPGTNGNVDFNDPCLSVSPEISVVFHEPPTATLTGLDTICPGENAQFQVQMAGTGPFTLNFAINGVAQIPVSAPSNTYTLSTNNVQNNQTFTLISIEDTYCIGTTSGTAQVVVRAAPTGILNGDATICLGDSTALTLQLSGGAPYDVTIGGGAQNIVLNNVGANATVFVTPSQTTTYQITSLTATGNLCPAVINPSDNAVITTTTLNVSGTVSDYGGFNVSCPGEDDGSIDLSTTGGVGPFTAMWSGGQSGLNIDQLAAGNYSVTVNDQVGCIDSATFVLTAPDALDFDPEIQNPLCAGASNGTIIIPGVSGGAGPFTFSLNGTAVLTSNTFPVTLGNLEPDEYLLEVSDVNGCVTTDTVEVMAPAPYTLFIGADTTLLFGETLILNGQTSDDGALDAIRWTPADYLNRSDSLTVVSTPFKTIRYDAIAVDTNGCVARDQMTITLRKDNRVYVPNAIATNSIKFNEGITVWAGPEVRKVNFLRIYDRWGEELFENKNFLPNDPQSGWKGFFKGQKVNPGVYVYVAEIEFIDGSTAQLAGDVTVTE